MKSSKFIHFHSRKCIWKCRLENGSHFVSGSMCWYPVRQVGHLCSIINQVAHDDVMTWTHSLHYWPFERGIHQSLVISQHKGPAIQSFDFYFVVSPNKGLYKQSGELRRLGAFVTSLYWGVLLSETPNPTWSPYQDPRWPGPVIYLCHRKTLCCAVHHIDSYFPMISNGNIPVRLSRRVHYLS